MQVRTAIVIGVLAPALTLGAQSSVADGRRSDLALFRRDFFAVDSSYSPNHRAEAERRLAKLEADAATVSSAFFELELARIVALADNGHTNSPGSLRSRRFSRVPLRFAPFGDQFYILRSDPANGDLLGARLLAIDGKPVKDVRSVAHTLWGGTPAYRDRYVPYLLESPEQMVTLGIVSAAASATYRLELRDGRTVERKVMAEPPDENRDVSGTSRLLFAAPANASDNWPYLISPDRPPWAFQESSKFFRLKAAPELNGFIVQLRSNVDAGDQSIQQFLDSALRAIRRAKPENIILDMRTNGGGDLNNTRDFAQALPALASKRVFVLTSPWTFSAAISTVGYLKQAGGNRVTIVGEMVGDRLEFWAEGRLLRLNYSSAAMSYSTQRHDYRTGCRPYKDCHGSVVRHPISVASLAPDIDAPLTIEAYIAGRDPGMEAIGKAIRGP